MRYSTITTRPCRQYSILLAVEACTPGRDRIELTGPARRASDDLHARLYPSRRPLLGVEVLHPKAVEATVILLARADRWGAGQGLAGLESAPAVTIGRVGVRMQVAAVACGRVVELGVVCSAAGSAVRSGTAIAVSGYAALTKTRTESLTIWSRQPFPGEVPIAKPLVNGLAVRKCEGPCSSDGYGPADRRIASVQVRAVCVGVAARFCGASVTIRLTITLTSLLTGPCAAGAGQLLTARLLTVHLLTAGSLSACRRAGSGASFSTGPAMNSGYGAGRWASWPLPVASPGGSWCRRSLSDAGRFRRWRDGRWGSALSAQPSSGGMAQHWSDGGELWLSVAEAAIACEVSDDSIRRRLPDRLPRAYRDGLNGAWRIPLGDLVAAGFRPRLTGHPAAASDDVEELRVRLAVAEATCRAQAAHIAALERLLDAVCRGGLSGAAREAER